MTFMQRVGVATKAAVGIFSDQSLEQAYGLLRGVLPGGHGTPPTRGTADYLRAYSQMPWLRAVTGRISTATARAEWQLFVEQKAGAKRATRNKRLQRAPRHERVRLLKQLAAAGDLKQVTDHPLLELMHNANEFQTGFSMRKVTQLHLDLVGDAFWLKERDALGTVVAVWPIPPHWIMSTPTPAFRYFRVSFRAWRGNIPDTEFVWFSDVDPLNPYGRGSGQAMSLGDELDTDEYAARMTKSFFYNQGRPDLIISPKGQQGVREASIKRLEEDWAAQSQGFFRAFKPYFLTREVDVKELEQNFRQLMLVPLRQFERDTILQNFGVPPEIMGVLESSNRATIESADYLMGKYVVEPRLEFQRIVLQERLVPEYDERLVVEYVSPVQEDKEHALKVAQVAPEALTVDEWRSMMGKAPLDDEEAGALHIMRSSVKFGTVEEPEPLDLPLAPVPPAPPGGDGGGTPEPLPGEDVPGPRRALSGDPGPVSAALDAGDYALAEALSKADEPDDEWPEIVAEGMRRAGPASRALAAVWREHAESIKVDELALALDDTDRALALLRTGELGEAQTAALVPPLVDGVDRGARLAAGSLPADKWAKQKPVGFDFEAVNAEATRWAERRAGALVQAPREVREIIALMVAEANEQGIPPRELARQLRGVVGLTPAQAQAVRDFARRLRAEGVADDRRQRRVDRYAEAQHRYRALNIARTEIMGALNHGQQALWDQAVAGGVLNAKKFHKTWIVTLDGRVCAACEGMADAQVPIGELFTGDVDQPPLHPSCRCTTGLTEVK